MAFLFFGPLSRVYFYLNLELVNILVDIYVDNNNNNNNSNNNNNNKIIVTIFNLVK